MPSPEIRRIVIPVPFARLGTVNAWLFPGGGRREEPRVGRVPGGGAQASNESDGPALFDCGIGTPEGYALVRTGLADAGVDPRALRLLISHGHVDHAGNAARLHRDFGVELWAPRDEAHLVSHFRQDSAGRNDAFADAMRVHGMPEDEVVRLRASADWIDQFIEDTPIQHEVRDGSRLVLGGIDVTVLRTPGHTPGSTTLLTADNRLLSGDTFLERITSNAIELLDNDRGAHHRYVQTVESLRRYVGVEVLPGHHDPFPLTDAVLDFHLDRHRRRSERILSLLQRPRTAYSLIPDIFPHLDRRQLFLAMTELVGHLSSLEIDGKVRRSQSPHKDATSASPAPLRSFVRA